MHASHDSFDHLHSLADMLVPLQVTLSGGSGSSALRMTGRLPVSGSSIGLAMAQVPLRSVRADSVGSLPLGEDLLRVTIYQEDTASAASTEGGGTVGTPSASDMRQQLAESDGAVQVNATIVFSNSVSGASKHCTCRLASIAG